MLRAALAELDLIILVPLIGLPARSPLFGFNAYGEEAGITALTADDLFLVRSLRPEISRVLDRILLDFWGFDFCVNRGKGRAGLSPLVFWENAGMQKSKIKTTQGHLAGGELPTFFDKMPNELV